MILVDTSVLVPFLTGHGTSATRYLERLVREDAACLDAQNAPTAPLAPVVIQKVRPLKMLP